jgi:[CysO sulfur-carrier protein]-S-L-cysteine hydrolase
VVKGSEWAAAAEAGADADRGAISPLRAVLPAQLMQQIIDAARDGLPNEACGLLIGRALAEQGGLPTRYVALRNAAASPYRYLIDADEQLKVMLELDEADEVVWGIVHSHVASAAVPSATDVGLAFYPDSIYLVCSLAGEHPVVRGWSIRDGRVAEVALAVSGA